MSKEDIRREATRTLHEILEYIGGVPLMYAENAQLIVYMERFLKHAKDLTP